MPIEKIKAKSETRLIVNPQAQDANRVAESVRTTADPTMNASLLPKAKNINATTESVAKINF